MAATSSWFTGRTKRPMYEYGILTEPYPDSTAIKVTPITPTRLIACAPLKRHSARPLVKLALKAHSLNTRPYIVMSLTATVEG